MEKKFNILCITNNDRIKNDLKNNLLGKRKNIGIKDGEISLVFSLKRHPILKNRFDIIILTICNDSKENVLEKINEIIFVHYQNPKSQIIVICEINPFDYSFFTQVIKSTKSFYFGTVQELAKRISEIIYLKKKK